MNGLLKRALDEDKNDKSKFVLISETTVPIKSLRDVHNALLFGSMPGADGKKTFYTDAGDMSLTSYVCFRPLQEWISGFKNTAYMPKHDQWISLSRPAAATLVERYNKFIPTGYIQSLTQPEQKVRKPSAVRKNFLNFWSKSEKGWGGVGTRECYGVTSRSCVNNMSIRWYYLGELTRV